MGLEDETLELWMLKCKHAQTFHPSEEYTHHLYQGPMFHPKDWDNPNIQKFAEYKMFTCTACYNTCCYNKEELERVKAGRRRKDEKLL